MRSIDFLDTSGRIDARYKGESILLLATEGSSDHWGSFEPLRGTSWAVGIELIDGEAYSNALHGYFLPLKRALGRDPKASGKRVTADEGECSLKGVCLTWDPTKCRPGGEGPPGCYDAPLSSGTPSKVKALFAAVATAWREGRHTIVVLGEGFNLR